ncbi:MAG: response regulator transcription factor [Bacteroidia bacterium]|nr:response regulator transcription factor [Bacteroidia bacterium]
MAKPFHIVFVSNAESSVKKTMEYLEEKTHKVTLVKSEEDLHHALHHDEVNLVIVELDYKQKDGITITSDIRNLKDIEQPFIILFSNKQDDYIQITAFNAGADDFIISPIKPILLDARISTLKKRLANRAPEITQEQLHPNFFVDKEQYLIITPAGKISLPRKEFEMVNLMYQNIHKTFTRQDFAKLIWNSPEVANSRTIDIHIRNIRRTLGNDIIKTTKGIGYTINRDLL